MNNDHLEIEYPSPTGMKVANIKAVFIPVVIVGVNDNAGLEVVAAWRGDCCC